MASRRLQVEFKNAMVEASNLLAYLGDPMYVNNFIDLDNVPDSKTTDNTNSSGRPIHSVG